MKLVVQVKLIPEADQALALSATLHAVNDAANMIPTDADWSLFAKTSAIVPNGGKGFGDPADIAGAIAMLASDDGKWITATALRIDGGAHG